MALTIYVDGCSKGNPGQASCAVVARRNYNGDIVHQSSRCLGAMTNNQAEYHGLNDALVYLRESGYPKARIHSDSQLIVRQVNNEYRVKSRMLFPLWKFAVYHIGEAGNIEVIHVPRDQNKEADCLANEAILSFQKGRRLK